MVALCNRADHYIWLMFAFVVLDLASSVGPTKRLARKNVSEMTSFVSSGTKTLTQSINLPTKHKNWTPARH